MKPSSSSEIRQAFLDYFEEFGHKVVNSAPLPQHDNPTLLFTNAGMNQFVDVFLGKETRGYKRAVTSQKCMRVQGKHNDLENVGPSSRHHTFFEMLGNFSFGDYFKDWAIRYAFEFLTKVCQIPEDRLWYTVHTEDNQAYEIWSNNIGVPIERILRMGDKTNFWMMGDVGPCGPTSEVHYDWGPEFCSCDEPDCGVILDNDCDRWLEIWNLVFMQFDQAEDGSRKPLPKPGVDTGMGLERITAVVENQPVNYDTDLFKPAMDQVQVLLGDTVDERLEHQTGYRVIADHGRAAAFLIGDGVLPGNAGRGYVLRMIIRRAARFGRSIGFSEPFLGKIAQVYIDLMGTFYPELRRSREHIVHTMTLEEERFSKTLDVALSQLELFLSELHHQQISVIPGSMAFDLYATHGLPLEITRDVVQEHGFTINEEEFSAAKRAHAEASGAGAFSQYDTRDNIYYRFLSAAITKGTLEVSGVDHDPYSGSRLEAQIVGLLSGDTWLDEISADTGVEIVTTATPFYVEAGGEVSDKGRIIVRDNGAEAVIEDAHQPIPGFVVHTGRLSSGQLAVGQYVEVIVDNNRRWDIRRNHTATHLLHRELRAILGDHVTQQGSLVAADRLRFDFSHGKALDSGILEEIEMSLNQAILANMPVTPQYMALTKAIEAGAMALFGEKYGDVVRTIRVGVEGEKPYSLELCGGLHVSATGDIGLFQLTAEEAVAAGVRRIEAVTGNEALRLVGQRQGLLDRLSSKLNSPLHEVEARLDTLLNENREYKRELADLSRARAREKFRSMLTTMDLVEGVSVMTGQVDVDNFEYLREMADWFREAVASGVAVFGAVKDDQPILVATVTNDLVGRGLSAGRLIGSVAKIVGGGGGGKPTLAQAGGRDVDKLEDALEAVSLLVAEALNS